MLRQAIDLPGVGNARELGGYAAGAGRVRDGVLIRTAGLGKVTLEALKRLRDEYRVQYVVDFRMSAERRALPDPVIDGAENLGLSVVEMDDFAIPEGVDPSLIKVLTEPGADRMVLFETSYAYGMLGPQVYVDFLLGERGKRAYAAFFQALLRLDEGRALLWHCTDGKDRTGCAAMLVLGALGASRETVLADYLLTNEYNASVVDAVRGQAEALGMPAEKADAFVFMCGGVVERYMVQAMETLEERYGGVTGYLADELGVGESELAELRRKFLVTS